MVADCDGSMHSLKNQRTQGTRKHRDDVNAVSPMRDRICRYYSAPGT